MLNFYILPIEVILTMLQLCSQSLFQLCIPFMYLPGNKVTSKRYELD
jgi:hypothetical protein